MAHLHWASTSSLYRGKFSLQMSHSEVVQTLMQCLGSRVLTIKHKQGYDIIRHLVLRLSQFLSYLGHPYSWIDMVSSSLLNGEMHQKHCRPVGSNFQLVQRQELEQCRHI